MVEAAGFSAVGYKTQRITTCTSGYSIVKDSELLRYSRHILLPQIDLAGQEALLRSHVAIIGLGGLGSPGALSRIVRCGPTDAGRR